MLQKELCRFEKINPERIFKINHSDNRKRTYAMNIQSHLMNYKEVKI